MMCVSTVDGVKLPVVHLDGVYADTFTPYVTLLAAIYPEVTAEAIHQPPNPPWTSKAIVQYLDLTEEAAEKMVEVIHGIPNYWAAVPKRLITHIGEQVVFYVDRLPTKGEPVLDQTIKWIRRELGIPSPIVWVADVP